MLKIDRDLSARLTNMMFVCTCLIMFMHLPYAGVKVGWLYQTIVPFTNLAVPAFFIMSGFLLAQHCGEKGWYGNELRKRFRSLVIPYFVLNTLFIPFLYLYHNIWNKGDWASGGLGLNWYSISRIYGLTYKYHPACGVMWYVRYLIFLVAISPLFVAMIRKSKRAAVAFCVALILVISVLEGFIRSEDAKHFFYSFINLRGVSFFSFGITLAYWRVQLPLRHRLFGALIALMLILAIPDLRSLDSSIGIVSVVLQLSVLWGCMPSVRLPQFLTSPCFVCFTLHSLIYLSCRFVIERLFPGGTPPSFMFAPILIVLASVGCLCFVIRRFIPVVGRSVFGGRV